MTARFIALCVAAALFNVATAAAASEPTGVSMQELLRRSGCDICHEAQPRTYARGSKSYLAPSWMNIAQRYGDDPKAEDRLTETILAGTGPRLTDQHWRGNVAFSDMPPNDVQLSPGDARVIVRWILAQPR